MLPQMDSKKLALLCRELADNRKAEDIVMLDVRKLSSVTDYFVIASGTSEPHLRAIMDEITEKLREDYGLRPRAVDGTLANCLGGAGLLRRHHPRHAPGFARAIRPGNSLGRCPAPQDEKTRRARSAEFQLCAIINSSEPQTECRSAGVSKTRPTVPLRSQAGRGDLFSCAARVPAIASRSSPFSEQIRRPVKRGNDAGAIQLG